MFKIYNTEINKSGIKEIKEFKKGSWVNIVSPTNNEIQLICDNLKIDKEFLTYPLDYDEQARIDKENDIILFIIDVPIIEKEKEKENSYETMPLGLLVVRDDFFITISLKENKIIKDMEKGKLKELYTYKKTRFILQILYYNASYYLDVLKKINKQAESTVLLLQKSMKNRELMQLLSLENSLVYITTSLRSNEVIMEKTLRGKVIKLYEEDEDILEDAIVENKQAIEMGKIYSDILSGTMDAYASIISNNLNVVMKFLAAITIVLSIPTMIASFWGMNVGVPFADSVTGFVIIVIISIISAILAYMLLKKKDML